MPTEQITGPDPREDNCPECGRVSRFGDLCYFCKKEYHDNNEKPTEDGQDE